MEVLESVELSNRTTNTHPKLFLGFVRTIILIYTIGYIVKQFKKEPKS